LKAVEALGRLKAQEATELLRGIAEARHMFHWTHPGELRLAAVQSMTKIDPAWAADFVPRSGFSENELAMAPLDPLPNAKYFRRRRYPRIRLSQPITAIAAVGQDSYRLEVRGLTHVRHSAGQSRIKSFEISLGNGRVCTTFQDLNRLQTFR
jgi:hypothetical protein